MTQFTELGLAAPILQALADEGYATPTPIQAQAIPVVMAGKDLLGIAQTGTGKTAAFALPIIHRLSADRRPAPRKGCRVLVLSPTRELATQIAASFKTYGRHLRLSVATVFGGVAHRPQIQALATGVDVLVATPGRLLDHVGERNAVLRGTEILVLDEADQMLDLGFVRPIRQIVAQLGDARQNLFFSATMPHEIAKLADELLRDPERVAVTPVASTVDRIDQRVIHIERTKKRALLGQLLADTGMSRTLVFTRTKRGADRVAQYLVGAASIQAAAIHGNKSQKQRELALDEFRRGRVRVLVATDIAARGIDIDAVSHVVNFDLPEVPEAYVHRIGRTARAGADGSAISLCDGDERHLLRAIERLTRRVIPAEDRRGDDTLASDKAMGPRNPEPHARAPRADRAGYGAGSGGAARADRRRATRDENRRTGGARDARPESADKQQSPDRPSPDRPRGETPWAAKQGGEKPAKRWGGDKGRSNGADHRSAHPRSADRQDERPAPQHRKWRDNDFRDGATASDGRDGPREGRRPERSEARPHRAEGRTSGSPHRKGGPRPDQRQGERGRDNERSENRSRPSRPEPRAGGADRDATARSSPRGDDRNRHAERRADDRPRQSSAHDRPRNGAPHRSNGQRDAQGATGEKPRQGQAARPWGDRDRGAHRQGDDARGRPSRPQHAGPGRNGRTRDGESRGDRAPHGAPPKGAGKPRSARQRRPTLV